MIRNKGSQLLAGLLILLLLLWLVAGTMGWIGRGVTGLALLLLSIVLWKGTVASEHRERAALLQSKQREYEHMLIRTLNHHRHDWMNDIQVLFGYIQLKKYDNLHRYMEKIKSKIEQESAISKLGDPALVAYLLSFRTQTNDVQLDVELEQDVRLDELPLDHEKVGSAIIVLLDSFKSHALPSQDGENGLSLELAVEDNYLLIDCVYKGMYAARELKQTLEQSVLRADSHLRVLHADFEEGEAVVAISVPFK
ncbi:Spo0B domain-containing protein [Paenibacillus hamazuiensis]|uniref:Spo0B domain-containing protein n=1 Tax=Paenibacillus hamazuiensis TaxID=2936508 RepID=UPI00200BF22E|nr:Spo0B domain-containing protein [Paenibacillus hamazuiensis]